MTIKKFFVFLQTSDTGFCCCNVTFDINPSFGSTIFSHLTMLPYIPLYLFNFWYVLTSVSKDIGLFVVRRRTRKYQSFYLFPSLMSESQINERGPTVKKNIGDESWSS